MRKPGGAGREEEGRMTPYHNSNLALFPEAVEIERDEVYHI